MRTSLVCVLAFFINSSAWGLNVLVDFTEFETQLNTAASSAGVTAFSGAESANIESGILTNLGLIYQDYTEVSFSATDTGMHTEQINMGATTTVDGLLGLASSIDWRNQTGTTATPEESDVYAANFAFYLDEFSGLTNRPQQISEITFALSNTAAHELGHNIGMQHADAYGFDSLPTTPVPGGSGTVDTGGIQQGAFMATFSSGLTEAGDDQGLLEINDVIGAKFEFTNGMVDSPHATQAESGSNNSLATADAVNLTMLSTVAGEAAVLTGTLAAGTTDYYSVMAEAGDLLTLHLMGDIPAITPFLDTKLLLFDSSGAPVDFGMNADDAAWWQNQWDDGSGFGTEGTDPYIMNFGLPSTDTYTIGLAGFDEFQAGDYELFLRLIPEPSRAILLVLGGLGILLRRRRATV